MDLLFEPNYQNVIGYFTRTIMRDLHLVGGFDVLFGKIKAIRRARAVRSAGRPRTTATSSATSRKSRRRERSLETMKAGVNALTVQDRGTTEVRQHIKLSEPDPSS